MTIGQLKSGSSAPSRWRKAETPPADAPMTTRRSGTSVFAIDEPVDRVMLIECGECRGMAGEAQRLIGAETQIAAAYEAVLKQSDRTLLPWRAKVDQPVAAQAQLRFADDQIG